MHSLTRLLPLALPLIVLADTQYSPNLKNKEIVTQAARLSPTSRAKYEVGS